jgi:hypothetical protein
MTEETSDFERAVMQQLEVAPPATGVVHDFSFARWGHRATFTSTDGGLTGTGHFFLFTMLRRPKVGDQIILVADGGGRTARYRLIEVIWCRDPDDMYKFRAVFDPRTTVQEMVR